MTVFTPAFFLITTRGSLLKSTRGGAHVQYNMMLVLSCSQKKRSPSHWDFSHVPISIFCVEPPQCVCVWQRWGLCLVVSGSLHGDELPVSFYSICCSVLLIRGAEVFSCLCKWSLHRRAALQPLPSVVKHEERVYAISQRLRLMFFLIYNSLRGNGNVTQGSHVWMTEMKWRKRSDVLVLVLYTVLFSVTSALDFSYHYKKSMVDVVDEVWEHYLALMCGEEILSGVQAPQLRFYTFTNLPSHTSACHTSTEHVTEACELQPSLSAAVVLLLDHVYIAP